MSREYGYGVQLRVDLAPHALLSQQSSVVTILKKTMLVPLRVANEMQHCKGIGEHVDSTTGFTPMAFHNTSSSVSHVGKYGNADPLDTSQWMELPFSSTSDTTSWDDARSVMMFKVLQTCNISRIQIEVVPRFLLKGMVPSCVSDLLAMPPELITEHRYEIFLQLPLQRSCAGSPKDARMDLLLARNDTPISATR